MSKLLLSCDEYAYSFNGKYYLSEFGKILVQRYLNVFSKIKLAVRAKYVKTEDELGKYNFQVDSEYVDIFPIPFFQGPIEYAQKYIEIKKQLRNVTEECDAAVFRLPSTVAFASLDIAIKKNIPYAVEIVANPNELKQNASSLLNKLLMTIWHKKLKKACIRAEGVSYVTKNSLQQLYPRRNGAFQSNYSSIELDNSFFYMPRNINGNDEIVIAHVSNPIKTFSKGHMTVLKIVRYLNDNGFKTTAKFAGEGAYVDLFKEKAEELGIKDKIEFVGLLNKRALLDLLIDSNIMVFPSSSEGLPRVLIEAMATGLPCLSTRVGGIPELLDENLLFDKDDVEGFSKKIIDIFSNKELYNRISKQNFEKSKKYSKSVLEDKRNTFYKQLLDVVSENK